MFCLAVVYFFVKIVFVSVLYKVYFQKAKIGWQIIAVDSVTMFLSNQCTSNSMEDFEWSAELQVKF